MGEWLRVGFSGKRRVILPPIANRQHREDVVMGVHRGWLVRATVVYARAGVVVR